MDSINKKASVFGNWSSTLYLRSSFWTSNDQKTNKKCSLQKSATPHFQYVFYSKLRYFNEISTKSEQTMLGVVPCDTKNTIEYHGFDWLWEYFKVQIIIRVTKIQNHPNLSCCECSFHLSLFILIRSHFENFKGIKPNFN